MCWITAPHIQIGAWRMPYCAKTNPQVAAERNSLCQLWFICVFLHQDFLFVLFGYNLWRAACWLQKMGSITAQTPAHTGTQPNGVKLEWLVTYKIMLSLLICLLLYIYMNVCFICLCILLFLWRENPQYSTTEWHVLYMVLQCRRENPCNRRIAENTHNRIQMHLIHKKWQYSLMNAYDANADNIYPFLCEWILSSFPRIIFIYAIRLCISYLVLHYICYDDVCGWCSDKLLLISSLTHVNV